MKKKEHPASHADRSAANGASNMALSGIRGAMARGAEGIEAPLECRGAIGRGRLRFDASMQVEIPDPARFSHLAEGDTIGH